MLEFRRLTTLWASTDCNRDSFILRCGVRLDAGFPPRRPRFASGQHVEFVMDKAALGRISPSTSVSPANHSTNFSIIIITRGWHNRPLMAAVSSGPNWTPPPLYQLKKIYLCLCCMFVLCRLYVGRILNFVYFFMA
jgi:hypothetical protein